MQTQSPPISATRTPACPVFGTCGGCSFQDIPYERQVAMKRDAVLDGFRRLELPLPSDVPVETGPEYGYRNRMDFVFGPSGLGQKKKKRFDQVVPFAACPISNPPINGLLAEVNAWFAGNASRLDVFHLVEQTGTLRYATIRGSLFTADTTVTFILNPDSPELSRHEEMVVRYAAVSSARNVLIGHVPGKSSMSITDRIRTVKGRDLLYEVFFDRRFWYHSQGFFQNNSIVTERMIRYASDCLAGPVRTLVDLYGGVGTFGVSLASRAGDVVIVENNPVSTACADLNIRENALANVTVRNGPAEGPSTDHLDRGGRTAWIVDPPRPGLHRLVIGQIKKALPERVIYVSCNPLKQAEDVVSLKPEYRLSDLRLFDMFPQTPHCESIALLVRA